MPGPIVASWLGRVEYRRGIGAPEAPRRRARRGRIGDRLLLLEHPAVLTLGRHRGPGPHPRRRRRLSPRAASRSIRVERGGEVTYHGPGQLVAYPILALSPRGLLVRPLVRALEAALVATCAAYGVEAARRDGQPGCWCDPDGPDPRKIGALGLRIERGVSYHGIALNVTVDLGRLRADRPVRDARRRLDLDRRRARRAGRPPTTASVERAARHLRRRPRRRSSARRWPGSDAWRPASSSCARTRSPAGGSRPSSIVPSIATVSRAPPSPSTTTSSAAPTARRPRATGSASGCSRTSPSTSSGPATTRASSTAGSARSRSPRRARRGAGGRSSRRRGEHRPLHAVGNEMIEALVGRRPEALAEARATGPDRLPPGRPELGRAGRRADQPPVPRPVRPAPDPAPDRRGDRWRGAVRDPRGRVPVLPARPRRDRAGRTRLVWEDDASVAFAPYASRSPFEVWIVPRRHEADFGRATAIRRRGDVRGAPPGPRPAGGQPRRPALQPRPAHGAAARAGRRDLPLALGDPPAPARDRRPRARDRVCRSTRSRPRTPSRSCSVGPSSTRTARVDARSARCGRGVTRGEVRRLWADERAPPVRLRLVIHPARRTCGRRSLLRCPPRNPTAMPRSERGLAR